MPRQSALVVPRDHILYTAQNDIYALCQPLFKSTSIKYFDYLRYYDDNTAFCLTTHPYWIEQYYLENLHPTLEEYTRATQYNILSHVLPVPSGVVDHTKFVRNIQLAKSFNIMHRFYMVKPHKTYFEVVGFGVIENIPDILEFYINQIDRLETFLCYFKENASELITRASSTRITLGHNQNKVDQLHKTQVFNILCGSQTIALTKREADCLYHLLQGHSAKQTAELLCISPRTVESYLDKVRHKTRSHSKLEVISKLDTTDFMDDYMTAVA